MKFGGLRITRARTFSLTMARLQLSVKMRRLAAVVKCSLRRLQLRRRLILAVQRATEAVLAKGVEMGKVELNAVADAADLDQEIVRAQLNLIARNLLSQVRALNQVLLWRWQRRRKGRRKENVELEGGTARSGNATVRATAMCMCTAVNRLMCSYLLQMFPNLQKATSAGSRNAEEVATTEQMMCLSSPCQTSVPMKTSRSRWLCLCFADQMLRRQ
jgi:hypothetical protein